jgi:NRAMP (natural resistance-associated macrophage protein)-like metal ion transporter
MKKSSEENRKKHSFFTKLGPGLITGASDDDPSGIATYAQAGAGFGLQTLWTSLLTIPMMSAIQEMCARIGLVTSKGLAATLRKHYPPALLWLMILLTVPAITLNIGANIQGMGAVAHMLLPQEMRQRIPLLSPFLFSFLFTAMLLYVIIQFPYRKLASVLKWLCLSLFLYALVPFMLELDWQQVLKAVYTPHLDFTAEYLSILVGILGTTISPYLFFWQATMEAEERNHQKNLIVDKQLIGDMGRDVNLGMIFSNLIMFFIILTAGSVLFPNGITSIQTVEQAAASLEPLVGKWAHACFALGIIGTGLLSIPVLAGAQSYLLSEAFGWEKGLDKKFFQAIPFYVTIAASLLLGLLLDYFGVSPVRALIVTAILYGLTAPVLIGMILHIGNNMRIMGEFTNSRLSNFLGLLTLLMMSAAAVALLWIYL